MSGIQTNFRAEDMIGAAKPEVVVVAKPAPALKGTKAAKAAPAPAPVVEEPTAVVEEVVVAEEPVVEG